MVDSDGWSRAQRRLHGISAGLVFLTFGLGWLMVGRPADSLLLTFVVYQIHKTFGLLVLVLLVWRLAERMRVGRPAWDAMPAWQSRGAAAMHLVLLVLLCVVPVLGYLTAATAPGGVPTVFLGMVPVPNLVGRDPAWFAVLRPTHRALAIVLVALAVAHAAMAIHHHRMGKRTLVRMWLGR